jgi:hypothetical protein
MDTENCLRRINREKPDVYHKINSWTIYPLIIGVSVGVAAALSRTSAYRRLLIPFAVIGLIFFVVVCLPKLFGALKELNRLKEAENQIYRQVETLIIDISTRINAVESIFPGTNKDSPIRFEINQELKDKLDLFIESLRLVHGWDNFRSYWQEFAPQAPLDSAEEGNLLHLNRNIEVITRRLPGIIQNIEERSRDLEEGLDPNYVSSDRASIRTSIFLLQMNALVASIRALRVEMERIPRGVIRSNTSQFLTPIDIRPNA